MMAAFLKLNAALLNDTRSQRCAPQRYALPTMRSSTIALLNEALFDDALRDAALLCAP